MMIENLNNDIWITISRDNASIPLKYLDPDSFNCDDIDYRFNLTAYVRDIALSTSKPDKT